MQFNGLNLQRRKSSSTASLTASCLRTPRTPYSTLPHELLACGEGASCIRRAEADRLAPRPHGWLPQDHEKRWLGRVPPHADQKSCREADPITPVKRATGS